MVAAEALNVNCYATHDTLLKVGSALEAPFNTSQLAIDQLAVTGTQRNILGDVLPLATICSTAYTVFPHLAQGYHSYAEDCWRAAAGAKWCTAVR